MLQIYGQTDFRQPDTLSGMAAFSPAKQTGSPIPTLNVVAMPAKKQRPIRRGVVLSESGFERVQRAHRRLELDENNGARISLDDLAHRVRLSTKTLSRLFSRDVPVDRRTIELLFAELHLRLGSDDVRSPSARARSDRFHFPQYRTTLFGREKELARLTELAAEHQVITLAGTGGIGKTRLAVEWARRNGGAYSHFAFLDTSVFTDGTTLREAVSLILMESALDGEAHLLVLDGCEHLIEAAAGSVRELLDAQPTFTVLATSREPLRVPGETVIRLATLAVPEQAGEAPAALALASPAFAMFVERARSFDDDFALPEASVPIVVEIVRRLEGLPLALELAAARGTHMTLQDLLASLDDHLATLSEDGGQTIPRHRSARALIDWGFVLLTTPERVVFACLAAFMGSSIRRRWRRSARFQNKPLPIRCLTSYVNRSYSSMSQDRSHAIECSKRFGSTRRRSSRKVRSRVRSGYGTHCSILGPRKWQRVHSGRWIRKPQCVICSVSCRIFEKRCNGRAARVTIYI